MDNFVVAEERACFWDFIIWSQEEESYDDV